MAYASKDTSAAIASEVEAYLIANPPSGGVQLGETSETAYRGDKGKTAYDHSQVTHQAVLSSGTNIKTINNNSLLGSGNIEAGGLTQAQILTRML